MTKSAKTRKALLAAMGPYVLKYGLNTASLRPLAQAAGTSDRMLIYHFGSKDGLIAALIEHLAGELAMSLTTALPQEPATTVHDCAVEIVSLLRSEPYKAYMRVWLDIVSAAGQGNESHQRAGYLMIEGFLQWLQFRLPPDTPEPERAAKFVLTLVEGVMIMDSVGQTQTADVAVDALADLSASGKETS
ncbi:MAG: TetR/AcrR family transcriptional regulator [Pseudomonadota bacterium]